VITEETLDRLTRLCDAATPAPWEHRTEHGASESGDPTDDGQWEVVVAPRHPDIILASELDAEDAEFVCAARAWMADLIDEVRRLRSGAR